MTYDARGIGQNGADPCLRMIFEGAQFTLNFLRFHGVEPRYHQIGFAGRDPLADRDNLGCRFTLTENDFRQSASNRSMMIDEREAQILEGQIAQLIQRLIRADLAIGNLLQQLADFRFGHWRRGCSGRSGRLRWSVTSRTARASLRATEIVTSPALSCSPGLGIWPRRSTTNQP